MTTYEVSLDKKSSAWCSHRSRSRKRGLAAANNLLAYTDGTGRIVLADRVALLRHVQSVFRAARQHSADGDPLDALRAARADDVAIESSRLTRRSNPPPATPHKGRKTAAATAAPSTRRAATRRATASGAPVDTRAVRQWARENGHTVADRGRIPAAVLKQYQAAH